MGAVTCDKDGLLDVRVSITLGSGALSGTHHTIDEYLDKSKDSFRN